LTCFNIVNIEDSPITRVIDDIVAEQTKQKAEKPVVLFDGSESDPESNEDAEATNKNIGLY
jgi:hypothetical protein